MRNLDNKTNRTTDAIIADMSQAISADDNKKFVQLVQELAENVKQDLTAEQEAKLQAIQEEADRAALAARGSRPMTSKELQYFTELGQAMAAKDPKQALANMINVMPETTVESVFEDLRTNHPLLSAIDFIPTGANYKFIFSETGELKAVWGELCDEIVQELLAGFKVAQGNLLKLSAFLLVCKQGFIFGPNWLDRYVREVLYESIANGLEEGIVAGSGKDEPIGMIRQVGPGTVVTDGVYPKKAKVAISDLDLATTGRLIAMIARDDTGKKRKIRDLILVCNEIDYYAKVLPATQVMGLDGVYRSVLPHNIKIVPVSYGLEEGEAVFGLGYRYAAAAGMNKEGNIEYSDHYRFLQDQRTYIIKAFANGFPKDGSAFVFLDISGLLPARYIVQTSENTPSSDATLASLKIGALTLSPTFAANTTSYTASTTNASNVVKAVPAQADAEVLVKLGDDAVPNNAPVAWAAGSNTLTVKVTAADGTTTKTYTVTVTKS